MSEFTDEIEGDVDSALTTRLVKVLELAERHGWQENPMTSVVIRLAKPGDDLARPFYMAWHLSKGEDGKRHWNFKGARAANGQPLNYRDCLIYLADPSVIYPSDPAETEEKEG